MFEKYKTAEECIRCNRNVLVKLKISTGKHELHVVDSAEAYKDGDWQEIGFTW